MFSESVPAAADGRLLQPGHRSLHRDHAGRLSDPECLARSEDDLHAQSLSAAPADGRVLQPDYRYLHSHHPGKLPVAECLARTEHDLFAESLSAAADGRLLRSGHR